MCIIAICKDRPLSAWEIHNCFTNNSDGVGFAYARGDKVTINKGYMTEEAFVKAYEDVNILPHVVHFRTTTSGGVSQELCHPFVVDEHSELVVQDEVEQPVLFHNGVIFDWMTLTMNMVTSGQIEMPKGPMNDTRMAAIMVATLGDEVLNLLSGKFVLVDPSGVITRWGSFENERGILFSNDGYKRVSYVYTNKNAGKCKGGVGTHKAYNDFLDKYYDEDTPNRSLPGGGMCE